MPRVRTAVTEALRDEIVTGLHVGRYHGGERLPAARALATRFGVNERVVLAALRAIADEGLIELKPRSGAYVAPPHPASGESLPPLGAWLVEMLTQARARGLSPRDVASYARRALETRRLRAACIECNLDSLHMLCSELDTDHGFESVSVELDDATGTRTPRELRDVDVLVTTMYHANAVQRVAKQLDKPCLAVGLRAGVIDDVVRRLRTGKVYYITTDPRFEPKLRKMLGRKARLSNLRVLVLGKDDIARIPHDAPTFVMPRAREQLNKRGMTDLPGHSIQPPRQLSDDAARALLSFVVRANLAAFAAGLGSD